MQYTIWLLYYTRTFSSYNNSTSTTIMIVFIGFEMTYFFVMLISLAMILGFLTKNSANMGQAEQKMLELYCIIVKQRIIMIQYVVKNKLEILG